MHRAVDRDWIAKPARRRRSSEGQQDGELCSALQLQYLTTRAEGDILRRHLPRSGSVGGRVPSGGGWRDGDGGDLCDG